MVYEPNRPFWRPVPPDASSGRNSSEIRLNASDSSAQGSRVWARCVRALASSPMGFGKRVRTLDFEAKRQVILGSDSQWSGGCSNH